jgi:2-hydroxychromene-2-carboxylate isomerase
MEPIKVEFMFDFGSPNAYLAEKVIPEIERRTGVRFEYVPVLLGGIYKLTNNRSPGEALVGIKKKPEFMELEIQRFIRRHNITTFRKNSFFPVKTLQLMRGAVAARFEGVFEPYFRAAYHHMWEEPKKMDDPASSARSVHIVKHRFRPAVRAFATAGREGSPIGAHAGRGRSWCIRLADLFRR